MVMAVVPDLPCSRLKLLGLLESVKSDGIGMAVTVRVNGVVLVTPPPTALTSSA